MTSVDTLNSKDLNMSRLLVTADDRTGALEIGGIVANAEFTVNVGTEFDDGPCSVVDVATRHMTPDGAYATMIEALTLHDVHRCHKMDSGLRGNWPHEIRAMLDHDYQVAIIPAFPAAGRRCKDGIVYIDDVPLLDSPFGADPLSAPCSNRPVEVMEEAGLTSGDFILLDADTEEEVAQGVQRAFEEDRVVVSPTGPIGHFAKLLYGNPRPREIQLNFPILIICGSLNATSRNQLDQLGLPIQPIGKPTRPLDPITVVATPFTQNAISNLDAEQMATRTAEYIDKHAEGFRTLLIIGGDTAASYLQGKSVEVLGTVATGVPIAEDGTRLLITKGGGIGTANTLREICSLVRELPS